VIEMDEHPTDAVRAKPDASINVALGLLKQGDADAFVTAGNTGASMAAALLTLGRIRGIGRPALATVFPTGDDRLTMLLDVGANADCRSIHLLQFAYMGSAYMERMFGIARPRVGLLSIGEEDSKGNQLTIEVNEMLRASRLYFAGNVEGKDLTKGTCDVAVMDGFTGNVVIKTAEGMAELMFGELRKAVELTPWNRAAGLILMSELRKVKRRLDYTEYGGAQLLGVNGVTVIGHGRSNARAVFSAIRAARDAVQNNVLQTLREVAAEIPARRGGVGQGVESDQEPDDD
jgi:glycerol-3-phosphate acyltransferase PlsX